MSLLLFSCLVISFLWSMTTGWAGPGGAKRDRTNAGGDSNAGRHEQTGGPDGYVFLFVIPTLLCFSLFSFRLSIFLWSTYSNGRGGMGRDQRRRRQKRRIGGATGAYYIVFSLFSSLSSILLLILILPQSSLFA